jgi:transposase-like protein
LFKEQRVNNDHKNARTTFHGRAMIEERVFREGNSGQEVAERLGVGRGTVYKWLARYRAGGREARYDQSSRPRRSPRRLPVGQAAYIAAMRRMRMS